MPRQHPDVESAVRREIREIHREGYGRAPDRVSVHVLEDMILVVLDDLRLLPYEALIVELGRSDLIDETRTRYQRAIEPSFRAAVERATGRRVESFTSQTQAADDYAVEFFRLAPMADR